MPTPLTIVKGKTLEVVTRWEDDTLVYKAVTAIVQTAPCRLTVTGHGVPDGWRVAFAGISGPTVLNAKKIPPQDSDMKVATVVDANTIELNKVSVTDLDAYAGGGFLVYYAPMDLAGFTARSQVKDKVGGAQLLLMTTENSRIVIDNTAKTIAKIVDAVTTAALPFKKGVYDTEMVADDGTVYLLEEGDVTVKTEVTTEPEPS